MPSWRSNRWEGFRNFLSVRRLNLQSHEQGGEGRLARTNLDRRLTTSLPSSLWPFRSSPFRPFRSWIFRPWTFHPFRPWPFRPFRPSPTSRSFHPSSHLPQTLPRRGTWKQSIHLENVSFSNPPSSKLSFLLERKTLRVALRSTRVSVFSFC